MNQHLLCSKAREDIIQMMRSERTRPEALEAHYGSAVPTKPLQALQRDALLTSSRNPTEDVYEMPMAEVRKDKGEASYILLLSLSGRVPMFPLSPKSCTLRIAFMAGSFTLVKSLG